MSIFDKIFPSETASNTSPIIGTTDGKGIVTSLSALLSLQILHWIGPAFSLSISGLFHKLVDALMIFSFNKRGSSLSKKLRCSGVNLSGLLTPCGASVVVLITIGGHLIGRLTSTLRAKTPRNSSNSAVAASYSIP